MKLLVKSEFFEVWVEGETIKDVWQQAAFWHSLPTVCPVDGTATRFGYSKPDKNEFYYLESSGNPSYQFQFGTRQEDQKLFPGKMDEATGKAMQRWTHWDGEKRVIVWENGRLLKQPVTEQANSKPVELTEEEKARQEMERIGSAFYGTGWPAQKKVAIDGYTKNNPSNLTVDHIHRIIARIKEKQQGGK